METSSSEFSEELKTMCRRNHRLSVASRTDWLQEAFRQFETGTGHPEAVKLLEEKSRLWGQIAVQTHQLSQLLPGSH